MITSTTRPHCPNKVHSNNVLSLLLVNCVQLLQVFRPTYTSTVYKPVINLHEKVNQINAQSSSAITSLDVFDVQ